MKWFYTGDIGRVHSDGCIEIIDRKKDIVKLQHGEYVSLGKVRLLEIQINTTFTYLYSFVITNINDEQVEAALSVCSFIDNIMVHADPFHNFCVALVVASQPTLEDWAKGKGITFNDFADLCQKPETRKCVQEAITTVSIASHFHTSNSS